MNNQELVQKYYGNKKHASNTHFCMVCRLSLPNNKTSILLHEQSASHKDNHLKVIKQGKLSKVSRSKDSDEDDGHKKKGRGAAFATQMFHEFHAQKRAQQTNG